MTFQVDSDTLQYITIGWSTDPAPGSGDTGLNVFNLASYGTKLSEGINTVGKSLGSTNSGQGGGDPCSMNFSMSIIPNYRAGPTYILKTLAGSLTGTDYPLIKSGSPPFTNPLSTANPNIYFSVWVQGRFTASYPANTAFVSFNLLTIPG